MTCAFPFAPSQRCCRIHANRRYGPSACPTFEPYKCSNTELLSAFGVRPGASRDQVEGTGRVETAGVGSGAPDANGQLRARIRMNAPFTAPLERRWRHGTERTHPRGLARRTGSPGERGAASPRSRCFGWLGRRHSDPARRCAGGAGLRVLGPWLLRGCGAQAGAGGDPGRARRASCGLACPESTSQPGRCLPLRRVEGRGTRPPRGLVSSRQSQRRRRGRSEQRGVRGRRLHGR